VGHACLLVRPASSLPLHNPVPLCMLARFKTMFLFNILAECLHMPSLCCSEVCCWKVHLVPGADNEL
jgi:hypothetical protein